MANPNPKVLLIDDDAELAELLRDYLVRDGFAAEVAHTGESGIRRAQAGDCDIVVLDYMLPGMSGIDVLRALRAAGGLPVLMLTARGDDTDRIVGLELGADDYVPKPCSPRELAARLRAILKRTRAASPNAPAAPLHAGPLTLWPAQRRAELAGRPLDLTGTEFNLLEVLARHAGQPVAKEALSRQALGRPHSRFDRAIDVHMSSIRHKLGPLPDGRPAIQTVIRKGYQLLL